MPTKTYGDIPSEEQKLYKPVDESGKAWVKKTVFNDGPASHALALTYNAVIDTMSATLPGQDVEALTIDKERIRGNNEKGDATPYCRAIQKQLIAATNLDDLDAVEGLLLDPQFSRNRTLLDGVSDEKLVQLLERPLGKSYRWELIESMHDPKLQLEFFEKYSTDRWTSRKKIPCMIFLKFIAVEDFQSALVVLDKHIASGDWEILIPKIQSADFLMILAKRNIGSHYFPPIQILKLIASIPVWKKIIDSGASEFSSLSDREKDKIIELAQKMTKALEQKMGIDGPEDIGLKFVFAVREDTGAFYLTWEEEGDSSEHRHIFSTAERELNTNFSGCMGGYISVKDEDDKKTTIHFNGNSEGYGEFSKGILEHYRTQIEEYFKEMFKDKEVSVVISPGWNN